MLWASNTEYYSISVIIHRNIQYHDEQVQAVFMSSHLGEEGDELIKN